MSRNNNWYYWEADDPVAGQAPQSQPLSPGGIGAPGQAGGGAPPPEQQQHKPKPSNAITEDPNEDDVTKDPQHPDLHDDVVEEKDFEEWKNEFYETAIKGDTEELLKRLKQMRDRDLDPTALKFIEDNINIEFLREGSEKISQASKEIRKLIKDSLDENYPATSIMQHICNTLEKYPMITDNFYKLLGTFGMKADLHRKLIASLLCAVQTGGGGQKEDIVYCAKDLSIDLSTRFSSEWGEIVLGKWSPKADDPQKYLEEPEIARLKDGAPEERIVMRHRVVLASIAEQFQNRAFLIHVANPNGTLHALGWDVGDSIKSGYVDGKLVVRNVVNESSEAFIDDDGNVITVPDLHVKFVMDTGRVDDAGRPLRREYPFIERIDGTLAFVASLKTIREMSNAMSGVFFKEMPYSGNPSDVKKLIRAVPTVDEILGRKQ